MANPWDSAPIVQAAGQSQNPWDVAPIVANADSQSGQRGHQGLGSIGNAIYGAAKGAADLVQAPAQLVLNAANEVAQRTSPDSSIGKYIGDKTKQFNDYLSNQERQYQEETPGSVSAGLGRVVSNSLPFALSGGGSAAMQASGVIPKAIQLAKLLGQGAGISAISEPVNNVVTDDNGANNFLERKGTQAAIGAAGNLLGAGAGKVLGKLINPSVSDEATAALNEGITPTIGQLLGGKYASVENKLTSLPFIGETIKKAQRATTEDFNRAAYNRVLAPIGESADNLPIGYAGVTAVKGKLSDAYNNLLSNINFKGDQQFGQDLQNIVSMVNNGNVPPSIASQFNSILKNNVLSRMTPNGTMDGKQFKLVESDLANQYKNLGKSLDPNQRQLGEALAEVHQSLKDSLVRSNPDQASELGLINNAYANYARVRGAASMSGANNGVFTPAQLASAVRSADKSVGKGDSATGQALMQDLANVGKNVAPTYPDSGTAGRMLELGTVGALLAQPQYAIPAMVAGAIGAAPYTAAGKKIAAAILGRRPDSAVQLSNAIQSSAPPLGAILSPRAIPFFSQQLNNGR